MTRFVFGFAKKGVLKKKKSVHIKFLIKDLRLAGAEMTELATADSGVVSDMEVDFNSLVRGNFQ